MKRIFVCALAIAALHNAPTRAADDMARGAFVKECIDAAASAHAVPPAILLILLNVENGRLGEVSQNTNKTVDIGPMQVNDSWLPKLAARWGASVDATYLALRDEFCANIEAGAWILRQALDEAKGDIWEGVGLYHSHTERHKTEYLRKVLQHAGRLQKRASAELVADNGGVGR
ncbi:MAG: lytic transglycosylase domain-containing protein [Methylocystis silviterrae]|uniref:lytic transglycosylase domain-containing protein n=1 Tax=Methylocystis silviterrae TaxID=2743612 RepID=UPI003C791F35